MYCPKCGAKVENTEEFCYKCGHKLNAFSENESADNQSQDKYTQPDNQAKEETKKKKHIGVAATVTVILLVIAIVTMTIIQGMDEIISNQKNYINSDALYITYNYDDVSGFSDFSYDIFQTTLLSKNCCDINNDNVEEEIKISAYCDNDYVYPYININNMNGMNHEMDYKHTGEDNSWGAQYGILLITSGKHYVFYSEEYNNIILLSTYYDSERNSIIIYDLDESKFTKQYTCWFENGEPYIIRDEYTDFSATDSGSALDKTYFLSYISEVRVELAEEGAHTFLTSQNEIENYQGYDDVCMICDFNVIANDSTGSIEYENFLG